MSLLIDARRVAMVVGASGVTGAPLAEQLATAGEYDFISDTLKLRQS